MSSFAVSLTDCSQDEVSAGPPIACCCIRGIGVAVPLHSASQEEAFEFMRNVLRASHGPTGFSEALLQRVFMKSAIDRRQSVLRDYIAQSASDRTFFPRADNLEPFPTTAQRMQAYEKESVPLAVDAARGALANADIRPHDVTHLVVSTCTGFFAPGPDVQLISQLGLQPGVHRTILGFMGCYAGVSGLRVCNDIVRANPNAVVLQVAVELCSLHYQKTPDPETMVANAIFSDGAAAAVYTRTNGESGAHARVLHTGSLLCTDTEDQMSWKIGDTGFVMRLGAELPDRLKHAAAQFVQSLAQEAGVDVGEITHWAVHPGGRRILEAVESALSLDCEQLATSYQVLREFGNMSSATILFVLQQEIEKASAAKPGLLCTLAFGPGLTIEGALIRIE